MVGACVGMLYLGFYFFIIAMIKCIKGSLFTINRIAEAERDPKRIMEQLIELLKFHSQVKQLSENIISINLTYKRHFSLVRLNMQEIYYQKTNYPPTDS